MNEIVVRPIAWGFKEYEDELALRNEILRVPLGMSLYEQDLSQENTYWHVGAFDGGQLVGTLLFIDRGDGVTQMRQVAVKESYRRHGVGRKMVAFGEEMMKGKGFSTIVLDARKVALEFYLALGYEVASEELILSGIPHFKMKKDLQ